MMFKCKENLGNKKINKRKKLPVFSYISSNHFSLKNICTKMTGVLCLIYP